MNDNYQLKTYTITRRNKRTLGIQWLSFDDDGDFLAYDAVWLGYDSKAIKFGTRTAAKDFLKAHLDVNTYAEEYSYMILENIEGPVEYFEVDK